MVRPGSSLRQGEAVASGPVASGGPVAIFCRDAAINSIKYNRCSVFALNIAVLFCMLLSSFSSFQSSLVSSCVLLNVLKPFYLSRSFCILLGASAFSWAFLNHSGPVTSSRAPVHFCRSSKSFRSLLHPVEPFFILLGPSAYS